MPTEPPTRHPRTPPPPYKTRTSPYAAQGREERRRILREHSGQIFPPNVLLALEIRSIGIENIPKERKIEIMQAHLPLISREGAKLEGKKRDPKIIEGILARKMPTLNEETINASIKLFTRKVIEDEKKIIMDKVEKRVRNYFKARKIPIDKSDLTYAVSLYLRDKKFGDLGRGIDLAEIEKTYFEVRKAVRTNMVEGAEKINHYLHQITKGLRFTANQKKHIKRWVTKEMVEHDKKMRVIFRSNPNFDLREAARKAQELDKLFISQTREKFAQQFTQPEKKSQAKPIKQGAAPMKLGTREERMAAYVPREKDTSSQARATEFKRTARYSREAGRSFNGAEYCLNEISRENNQAGESLRRLHSQQRINANAIVSLFISGSLTQKTFLNILEQTDFVQRFGTGHINTLANGLSFIGPTGKPITRAKRAINSPKRDEIFRFLETNGYFETHHGGGKVVYLKRR